MGYYTVTTLLLLLFVIFSVTMITLLLASARETGEKKKSRASFAYFNNGCLEEESAVWSLAKVREQYTADLHDPRFRALDFRERFI